MHLRNNNRGKWHTLSGERSEITKPNGHTQSIKLLKIKRLGEGKHAIAFKLQYIHVSNNDSIENKHIDTINTCVKKEFKSSASCEITKQNEITMLTKMEYYTGSTIIKNSTHCIFMPYFGKDFNTLDIYKLNINDIFNILLNSAKALLKLKNKGIVHGDIKPANIFFNKKTGAVSLSDFDCSSLSEDDRSVRGTVAFWTPEMFNAAIDGQNVPHTFSTDLGSLGITLAKLLGITEYNERRFIIPNGEEPIKHLISNGIPDEAASEIVDLLRKTIAPNRQTTELFYQKTHAMEVKYSSPSYESKLFGAKVDGNNTSLTFR